MDQIRISIVSHDSIFPPNHGGRVDIFRRLKVLRDLNCKLQFIFWENANEQPAVDEEPGILDCVIKLVLKRKASYLLKYFYLPFPIATHTCTHDELCNAVREINEFNPSLVIVEGLLGGFFYLKIRNKIGSHKAVYRSQNIEFLHNYIQIFSAGPLALKIKHLLDAPRMAIFEYYFRRQIDTIWDITEEDSKYFGGTSKVLYPFLPQYTQEFLEPGEKIVFIGNLHNPNNVEGLQWFFANVFSKLPKSFQENILLAGSNPDDVVMGLARRHGSEVLMNPPDINAAVIRARVLINPTQRGTGLNMKTIEMLQTGRNIITCTPGANGIPRGLLKFLTVCKTPDDFASAIINNFAKSPVNLEQIQATRETFSADTLKRLLQDLTEKQW